MMQVKNKRSLKIILYIMASFFFIITVYSLFIFKLFDVKSDLIASFNLAEGKDKIEIYYISPTATTNENIQIIQKDKNGKQTTLKIIEGYKLLKKLRFLSHNTFEIEIGNKYSKDKLQTDSTFVVHMK